MIEHAIQSNPPSHAPHGPQANTGAQTVHGPVARNVSQRLRDEIEDAILAGQFMPGERLDEMSMAARFQVSRTPIREALHQLAMAGIVEIRPRRGAVVAIVTPDQLYEMFEVMAELESFCARRAARRITDETATELLAAHEACKMHLDDPAAYYDENERFHQVIYHAAGNTFLATQAEALQKRLRPYRRLQLRVRNRVATSFCEHQRIIDAIVSGNADAAADAIRDHVRVQGERFSDLVASLAKLRIA